MQRSHFNRFATGLGLGGYLLTGPAPLSAQTAYSPQPFAERAAKGVLNNKGEVAFQDENALHLFLPAPAYQRPAGVTNLTAQGGPSLPAGSLLRRINNLGEILGVVPEGNGVRPFLWLPQARKDYPANWNLFTGTSLATANLFDLNDKGQVVGRLSDGTAFLWLPKPDYQQAAGIVPLAMDQAQCLNAKGQVAGLRQVGAGANLVLWLPTPDNGLPAGITSIPHAPFQTVAPVSINSRSEVVGSGQTSQGARHAFLWLPRAAYGLEAGMHDLGVREGADTSEALRINDSGQILLRLRQGTETPRPFLWQNGYWRPFVATAEGDLNASGQLCLGNLRFTPIAKVQPNQGGNQANSLLTALIPFETPSAVTRIALRWREDPQQDIVATHWKAQGGTALLATFDLAQQPPGSRNIVLTLQGGTEFVLPHPFTVSDQSAVEIGLNLLAGIRITQNGTEQDYLQVGQDNSYQIVIHNRGNVDAVGVVVWFTLPQDIEVQLKDPYRADGSTELYSPPGFESFPDSAQVNGLKLFPVVIPRLPANSSRTLQAQLHISVQAASNHPVVPLEIWADSFHRGVTPTALLPIARECLISAIRQTLETLQLQQALSPEGAADSLGAELQAQITAAYTNANANGSLFSLTKLISTFLLKTLEQKGYIFVDPSVLDSVLALAMSTEARCVVRETILKRTSAPSEVIGNPGELGGPLTCLGYLSDNAPIPFTFSFSNPAESGQVVLEHQLDPSLLDLDSFNITGVALTQPFRLERWFRPMESRVQYIHEEITLPGQSAPISVQIGLDTATGKLTCLLKSLPANASGQITYTVAWKPGLPLNSRFTSTAAFAFKGEPPTAVSPADYLLDNAAPISRIKPLTEPLRIEWEKVAEPGCDRLKDYTIFYQEEGGPLQRWLEHTSQTSALFTLGTPGKTYRFFSTAQDDLGNEETMHSVPDATILWPSLVGKVALQYCSEPSQTIQMEFRPEGGGTPFQRSVGLDSQGRFALTNVPPAQYQVAIKGAKWLRRTLNMQIKTEQTAEMKTLLLLAGDANNDNAVDIFDLGTLANDFNSGPADLEWNGGRSDFNCDNNVNIYDLAILAENFNQVGDP